MRCIELAIERLLHPHSQYKFAVPIDHYKILLIRARIEMLTGICEGRVQMTLSKWFNYFPFFVF